MNTFIIEIEKSKTKSLTGFLYSFHGLLHFDSQHGHSGHKSPPASFYDVSVIKRAVNVSLICPCLSATAGGTGLRFFLCKMVSISQGSVGGQHKVLLYSTEQIQPVSVSDELIAALREKVGTIKFK